MLAYATAEPSEQPAAAPAPGATGAEISSAPELLYAWITPEGFVHAFDFERNCPGRKVARWTRTGTRDNGFAVCVLARRKWIAPIEWDIGAGAMLCFKRDRMVFHQ